MNRRTALALAAAPLLAGVAGGAQAQGAWPDKMIKLVVPFPAGGPTDTASRIVGQKLAERLKQPVVVDNRPGASGSIAAAQVAKSPADGYTLMMLATPTLLAPHLYRKTGYDTVKDFAPVGKIGDATLILVSHPSFPGKTLKELIDISKKDPKGVSYGTSGVGGTPHIAGELLNLRTGAKLVHVPYKGSGPALADVLGGQLSFMFDTINAGLANIQAGKAVPLGVTSSTRSSQLPDVPTIAESGLPEFKGFEAVGWLGLMAPKGTPQAIIDTLNREAVGILRSAEMQKFIRDRGSEPTPTTPQEMDQFVASEIAEWGKAVKQSGASVD